MLNVTVAFWERLTHCRVSCFGIPIPRNWIICIEIIESRHLPLISIHSPALRIILKSQHAPRSGQFRGSGTNRALMLDQRISTLKLQAYDMFLLFMDEIFLGVQLAVWYSQKVLLHVQWLELLDIHNEKGCKSNWATGLIANSHGLHGEFVSTDHSEQALDGGWWLQIPTLSHSSWPGCIHYLG